MKIHLLESKSSLWQWDLGQQIVIEDADNCEEVHFSLGESAEAYVVKIQDQDGKRCATIPNILLQNFGKLNIYLISEDEDSIATYYRAVLVVRKRPKPFDYVYTETEVLNYAYLDKRLQDLEGEGLANAVADYLEKNPVEAGATAEEAAQIAKNKTDIEQLSTGKLDASKLPEAVNDALAQAKASGQFDGEDGKTPVKGTDYFTEADKREIAELTAEMVDVPTDDHINDLINTALGVIENGTY